MRDKCRRQGADKCKLVRPKAPRVGDKCGKQVWETRCGPKHPEWEPSVGDEGETNVNPEWKTSVENKCGRQVEGKCKLMRPKAPRVRDKCGRRKTSVNSWGHGHPE